MADKYKSDRLENLLKTHYSHPVSGKMIPKMTSKAYDEVEDNHKEHVHSAAVPLSRARAHLDRETERGEHAPKVGGHKTHHHGGRVRVPLKEYFSEDYEHAKQATKERREHPEDYE